MHILFISTHCIYTISFYLVIGSIAIADGFVLGPVCKISVRFRFPSSKASILAQELSTQYRWPAIQSTAMSPKREVMYWISCALPHNIIQQLMRSSNCHYKHLLTISRFVLTRTCLSEPSRFAEYIVAGTLYSSSV